MKRWTIALSAGLIAASVQTSAIAQDGQRIQVVTENGAQEPIRVEGSRIVFINDDEAKVVEGKPITVEDVEESAGKKRVELRIETSSTSNGEDGDPPKVVTKGKVVVVGPDGQKKEYDVNGAEGQAILMELHGDKSEAGVAEHEVIVKNLISDSDADVDVAEEERLVIGVQCEEATELLRGHLKLGAAGVVVLEVRDETPAAEAGIQKNDIVVSIDEKPVGTKEELVEAVTGSDGKELHLEILRAGDKQKITVTPKKMKVPVVVATVTEDMEGIQDIEGLEKLPENIQKMIKDRVPGVRIQRIHPGVIVEGKAPTEPAEMHKMIEKVRRAAELQARDAQLAAEDAKKAHDNFKEQREVHESMKQLHEEMKAMQEELHALRKQLKEEEKEDEKE
ncbi:MAG: PDZ domain-containing protein [Planctomycetaceae bacterium]|nr:PDZ domain-containing protein [Planctomycetaceae bacterium]